MNLAAVEDVDHRKAWRNASRDAARRQIGEQCASGIGTDWQGAAQAINENHIFAVGIHQRLPVGSGKLSFGYFAASGAWEPISRPNFYSMQNAGERPAV
jgi:hypothetical protein